MFNIGDKVIVLKDIDGNNTKDKIGTIISIASGYSTKIHFEPDQRTQYNNWNIKVSYLKLYIEEQQGEY